MKDMLRWLGWKLGFRSIAHVTVDPPPHLVHEIEPGLYHRPRSGVYSDFTINLNWRGRLRVLVTGRIQVVTSTWFWEEQAPTVAGDLAQFEVLPPKILT